MTQFILFVLLPFSSFAADNTQMSAKIACLDELAQFEFGNSRPGTSSIEYRFSGDRYFWDGQTIILKNTRPVQDKSLWSRGQLSNGRSGRIDRNMTETQLNSILSGFISESFEGFVRSLVMAKYAPANFAGGDTSTSKIIRTCGRVANVRFTALFRSPRGEIKTRLATLKDYARFIEESFPRALATVSRTRVASSNQIRAVR